MVWRVIALITSTFLKIRFLCSSGQPCGEAVQAGPGRGHVRGGGHAVHWRCVKGVSKVYAGRQYSVAFVYKEVEQSSSHGLIACQKGWNDELLWNCRH